MKPSKKNGKPQSTPSNDVTAVETKTTAPDGALEVMTKKEHAALAECEDRIKRGWTTFVEVGDALAQIRDQRLYKETHSDFDAYCADRWQYGRGYADRLIGTSKLAQQLTPIGVTIQPTHEAQLRPLLGLSPDQATKAWLKAAKEADGKPPTAKLVAAAVTGFRTDPPPGNGRSARSTSVAKMNKTLGKILDQLSAVEGAVKEGMAADEVMKRIGCATEMVAALHQASTQAPGAVQR